MDTIQLSESTLPSADGASKIYVRKHVPEGEACAIIQISHGVAEHIERYDGFARYFAEKGFVVAGNDHLGHGRSVAEGGVKGYFAQNGGWDMVVTDLRRVTETLQNEHPGKPMFLLGHSMGSFLARTYIIVYTSGLAGVILSGTGQQPPLVLAAGTSLARGEVKKYGSRYVSERIHNLAFSKYNRNFEPVRTNCDWISRDAEVVDKYIADENCGFLPCVGLYLDMFTGLKRIADRKNLSRMDKALPVYFFSGDRDPVGANGKGVQAAYRSFVSAGCRDVTIKLYPGGRHEMLNETNRQEVMDDLLAWICARLPK